MTDYLQYVHNLKGVSQFERFKPAAREAIMSILLKPLQDFNALEKTILKASDKEVLHYISDHIDLKAFRKNIILTTAASSYIDEVDFNNVQAIINLKRVNFTQHPNKLFRAVNTLLPDAGIFIGSLENYGERKEKLCRMVGNRAGSLLWLADFIINRVVPRIPYLDDLYYYLTNGQFHAISISEVLGRLIYCGFEIIDVKTIHDLTYFVARKIRLPADRQNPSYYPVIKLNRVGQDGKMFWVYKFRTMHPYSEYLQCYVLKLNGYNDKGKLANDFRITRWGKFLRRFWFDEFPQIINLLKGDMKLVGLRPVSLARFNEFPEDLKMERIKYKPGCFPPYVALNIPDDKVNILAERIYINDLKKHPRTTDLRYFCMAVYNILTNKISGS